MEHLSSIDPYRSVSPHIRRMLPRATAVSMFPRMPLPMSDEQARQADLEATAQDWQQTVPYVDHTQFIEQLKQSIKQREEQA